MADTDIRQVVIAAGTALSPQIDIGTKSLVGLVIPSNWVAAAGGISFQVSIDGGTTWNELSTGTATIAPYFLNYTSAGAACLAIDPTILRGFSSFKIRSGTVGTPVNQTNSVTLSLVTRLAL